MANFFIDRPVFAWVIAIVIMLAGLMSLRALPVSQYPDIAPTTVRISASYPGATAEAENQSASTRNVATATRPTCGHLASRNRGARTTGIARS